MSKHKVKTTTVRFPAETLERFTAFCEDTGQSKHGVIVKAVQAYIYNYYHHQNDESNSYNR